jgi:hypothetical protein
VAAGGNGRSPSWRVSSTFIRTGSTTGKRQLLDGAASVFEGGGGARACWGKRSLEKRCPSDGGPRVRIHLPPAQSPLRTCPPGFGAEAFGWPGRLLQAREVEREDQREKGLEQTEEGMVVDMPRPGLRHRPQSPGTTEGNALGEIAVPTLASLNRLLSRTSPGSRKLMRSFARWAPRYSWTKWVRPTYSPGGAATSQSLQT